MYTYIICIPQGSEHVRRKYMTKQCIANAGPRAEKANAMERRADCHLLAHPIARPDAV